MITQPPLPTYTPRPTYTRVPTDTPIPAPPTPSVTLPFGDNFDNGVNKMWIRKGDGDWQMENGRLVNKGASDVLWLGKADWTDIVVDASLEGRSTCDQSSVELLVRMQDPSNYVAVRRLGDLGGYCLIGHDLVLVKNGKLQKKLVGGLGGGSKVKVEVIGDLYKVFIDGQLRGSATDQTFSSGSVGFIVNGEAAVDDFYVRTMSP